MKTIGLIGGMSWESSIEYYRIVNEAVRGRLGGFHSAQCLMYSVDFAEIEELQRSGAWGDAGELLGAAARRLERGGADLIVLCTNTMHMVADQIAGAVQIPLLHIADPTADAIRAAGLQTVGLLGTRFTMEQAFYRGRLEQRHGLRVLTPSAADRDLVHRVIYEELVLGQIRAESRAGYLDVIGRMVAAGAQGIILGCTEIGLLVGPGDTDVPLFDTTSLHATAAVAWALG
jgi:aspartate racemase